MQESNPSLLPCRQNLYHLSHQGNPKNTGVGSHSLHSLIKLFSQAILFRTVSIIVRLNKRFWFWHFIFSLKGFPGGSMIKNPPASAGDEFDLWIRKISWRRKWQLFQYPCLENPMDRGVWWAAIQGVAKSQTQQQLNTHTHTHFLKSLSNVKISMWQQTVWLQFIFKECKYFMKYQSFQRTSENFFLTYLLPQLP